MSKYESLIIQANEEGVIVLELNLGTNKKCGKYINNIIVINSNLSNTEKFEVLAEELGHHRTTSGNITDLSDIRNIKLENIARREGYKIILDPKEVIKAIKNGACNLYEFAEYLNTSEEVLLDIIEDWKKIHGLGITIDDYYLRLY